MGSNFCSCKNNDENTESTLVSQHNKYYRLEKTQNEMKTYKNSYLSP